MKLLLKLTLIYAAFKLISYYLTNTKPDAVEPPADYYRPRFLKGR